MWLPFLSPAPEARNSSAESRTLASECRSELDKAATAQEKLKTPQVADHRCGIGKPRTTANAPVQILRSKRGTGLWSSLIAFAGTLLAVALTRQGGFDALFLAGLQIVSVPFYFLNNILL